MRRFVLLVAVGAAGAAGAWLALRSGASGDSTARVTSLLPGATLAFVHVPDLKRARRQWRETDIYKLWREPAVQEFLQRPLTRMPKPDGMSARLQELERLGVKDAFVAITSWQSNELKMVGGFRFKAGAAETEKVVGKWRARLRENAPTASQETIQHQKHRIEVAADRGVTIATVYAGDWFFAANNIPELTALLDRVDGSGKDAAITLSSEDNFTAAFGRMPTTYAAAAYARLDEYFARFASTLPQNSNTPDLAVLRQIRNVAAATRFENGKIRDVLFITVPRAADAGELARASLSLATPETFLYVAAFLNMPKGVPLPAGGPLSVGSGFAGRLQQLAAVIAASGVSVDEWNSAFGAELGVIGDWPAPARIPALLATLPVKDAAKADEIVMTMTAAAAEGSPWAVSERDGVRYYSQMAANPLIGVSPTIAVGNGSALVGLNAASVESAMKRGGATDSQLAGTAAFKAAEGAVPRATHSFAYIDTALLYTRLDAALRPMLIMSAAFVPGIAQTVDLGKLPDPEVIARHLSPIVLSQSYHGDGYLTESVGPISMVQAVLGVAGASGAGAMWYQNNLQIGAGSGSSFPAAVPTPSPSPEETP